MLLNFLVAFTRTPSHQYIRCCRLIPDFPKVIFDSFGMYGSYLLLTIPFEMLCDVKMMYNSQVIAR